MASKKETPKTEETAGPLVPVTPEAAKHRADFRAFVQESALPFHREHLGRLYAAWETWNKEHFGGKLAAPYITFAEPPSPRALGSCSTVSDWGGVLQIRVRPSVITGRYAGISSKPEHAEGRLLFALDILLHEMIHQYHFELTGQAEQAYGGHGPAFRDVCNKIGEAMGLPKVRDCKARGADKDLPSCAHWPLNVRPAGYYQGATDPENLDKKGKKAKPEPEPEPEPAPREEPEEDDGEELENPLTPEEWADLFASTRPLGGIAWRAACKLARRFGVPVPPAPADPTPAS
jgi:hypothetical protein